MTLVTEMTDEDIVRTPLRTHIVPLGFEFERIIQPLDVLRAEKVIFLKQTNGTLGLPYLEKIREHWKLTKSTLLKKNTLIECELFDWWDVVTKISKIYRESKAQHDELHINLSSGTKICAMAGYYACLITDIQPYYAQMENYAPNTESPTPISSGFARNLKIPYIRIKKPDRSLIWFLKLFKDSSGADRQLTKRDCVDFIFIIDPDIKHSHDLQAKKSNRIVATISYTVLKNKYIEPLLGWGYIKISRKPREKIKITKDGERNLQIYSNFYLL
jgi:predicted transcriptional regulator